MEKKNILNANEFFTRFKENKLKNCNVCFTFDDGIKSQYDIAYPVLENENIKAFFFIYSSIFTGKPDLLEVHRYFRNTFYVNIDDFYEDFFKFFQKKNLKNFLERKKNQIKSFKKIFPHYSFKDIEFRFIRNELISKKKYDLLMGKLFMKKKFRPKENFKHLFMSKEDIIKLHNTNHIIGLHSHSHPTLIEKLNLKQQENEYKKNLKILKKILKNEKLLINTVSHPCGSYNKNTLSILKKIGVEMGFKQIMKFEKKRGMIKINNSKLEIARQDHSEIMRILNK